MEEKEERGKKTRTRYSKINGLFTCNNETYTHCYWYSKRVPHTHTHTLHLCINTCVCCCKLAKINVHTTHS